MGSPPAVGVDEDRARASMTRALVAGIRSETTGAGLRLGLNRAAYRTRTENASRGAIGFVETVFIQNTPDVVRRSATLPFPLTASLAWDHTPLPPPDRFAVCPPP